MLIPSQPMTYFNRFGKAGIAVAFVLPVYYVVQVNAVMDLPKSPLGRCTILNNFL